MSVPTDPNDAPLMGHCEHELRQAVTLNCADALAHNVPLSTTQQRIIESALRRLVSTESFTEADERRILVSFINVGLYLNPPLRADGDRVTALEGQSRHDDEPVFGPQEHPLSFRRWDCSKYGHWTTHDGPCLCAKCGDHVGSVLSEEPYDYSAARRELEAIHAYLRAEWNIVQAHGDGEWGQMTGYYEPEWDEWGGTVEALRKIARIERFEGYCRAQIEQGTTTKSGAG